MSKIESIALYFPMSEEGCEVVYRIGKKEKGKEITEIRKKEKNGELAITPYYEIYSGKELIAELHHFSLVTYSGRASCIK